jgi:hypothetical protein
VNDGEGEEEILGGLLFESLVVLVPLGTFEVKTVHEDTFIDTLDNLAFDSAVITRDDLLQDFSLVVDLIEGPSIFVLAGNLLFHGGEETLGIEEPGQPEGWWAFSCRRGQPIVKLVMSIEETLQPSGKGRSQP